MSTRQKRILWPVFLFALLALGAFAFASARRARGSETARARAIATQNSNASANPDRGRYVSRRALWPQLRKNLEVLGDRLEKPGKERMILAGTVKYAGDRAGTPFELRSGPFIITLLQPHSRRTSRLAPAHELDPQTLRCITPPYDWSEGQP